MKHSNKKRILIIALVALMIFVLCLNIVFAAPGDDLITTENNNNASEHWITSVLKWTLSVWESISQEIRKLLTTNPRDFKDGIWPYMDTINRTLTGIGFGLLTTFFFMGVFKSAGSLADFKRPEVVIKTLVRFVCAKTVVGYSMQLLLLLIDIIQGVISQILQAGQATFARLELPAEIVTQINSLNFLTSLPVMIVALITLLITVGLSLTALLMVYMRFFKIYIYTAIAPIPLSGFAGEPTANMGKAFIKSYSSVLLEGAAIAIACIVYTAFLAADPINFGIAGDSAIMQVIAYSVEMILGILVFVGTVKESDSLIQRVIGA